MTLSRPPTAETIPIKSYLSNYCTARVLDWMNCALIKKFGLSAK
jgi:hypothetical protein